MNDLAHELQSRIVDASTQIRTSRAWTRFHHATVDPTAIVHYVSGVHRLIQATPVHLQRAAQRARVQTRPDLARHYLAKREEERGHDRWSAADLHGLAAKFGTVRQHPSPAVDQLFATIERSIDHNASAYLAYMLLAEHLTVLLGAELVDLLRRDHGLSREHFSAIVNHVELDAAHTSEGYVAVENLARPDDGPDLLHLLGRAKRGYLSFLAELADLTASATPAKLGCPLEA